MRPSAPRSKGRIVQDDKVPAPKERKNVHAKDPAWRRRARACLALLLAACGGGNDAGGGTQPNEQSSVTVGSTNFSEQLILAQMYAAVLEKAGVDVTVRPNLGNQEVVFPALEKGEIDLLPEYNGSVLSFLQPDATQTTADEVNTALRRCWTARAWSPCSRVRPRTRTAGPSPRRPPTSTAWPRCPT